jgi:perosamine synthetase
MSQTPIEFAKPFFDDREAAAAAAVVRSGWVVGGPKLAQLERMFAARCAAAHAVGVSSWTTGAFLVLHAWGLGPGDEVIVPSLTFIASVNVIRHVGATPVFVEIDPRTWTIDPTDVEAKITPRTRAIMPIDQLGMPCDIDAINAIAARHGLRVLQDAACAIGARLDGSVVGSRAEVAVFSLHARKVVTAGEGGMIVTSDATLAKRLRLLRHQGMSLSDHQRHAAPPTLFEDYPEIGYNFRITDIQAAIGVVQMDKLDDMIGRRRTIAECYNRALANHALLAPPYVPPGAEPNWQTYQVSLRHGSSRDRNAVMEKLYANGIPTRRGVMASHLEPPYRNRGHRLPTTEACAATTLQLPMHAGLTSNELDQVIDALAATSLATAGDRP